jgi:hypothetical protein
MFAPIPLTNELSPLAHAAVIVRRRLADNPIVAVPRYRIPPANMKKDGEKVAA